ncbi:hypothetical protein MMC10_007946 [Thelotrema lepadinum]|nr:hypothetical protein [Thelotrema lepadinum]
MNLSTSLPTAVDYTNVLVNYIEVSADDLPKDESDKKYPPGIHPPMVLPPGVATKDFEPESTGQEPEEKHQVISTKDIRYGQMIPRYLTDLDRDTKSHRFQRAANHVQEIPTPPSLPLFLSKSILNGTMPMKDDSSVLNMPSHTVLNHLATSSIKNDVLATSVTTRYKRKYVTTIIYRSTTDDDDRASDNTDSNEQK